MATLHAEIFFMFEKFSTDNWVDFYMEVAGKFGLENTIKNTQNLSDDICLLICEIFILWF